MTNKPVKTLIIGHRNPDMDSIAACYAFAELKRMRGQKNVSCACLGLPGARPSYLFEKFNLPLPAMIHDVYPRVRDIVDTECPRLDADETLFDAIKELEKNHKPRLPVVDAKGKFVGMLCLYSVLGELLQTGSTEQADAGLTGRKVHSTLALMNRVLHGEALNLTEENLEQDFEVYVAAMGVESFQTHIPAERPHDLAIIVGDRTDIHLMAINLQVRLMIITGTKTVDEVVLQAAKARNISIIRTPFDSATVVRRLKFSSPVGRMTQTQVRCYRSDDRLSEIKPLLLDENDDVFPVINKQKQLVGTFCLSDLDAPSSLQLVLVDHNEFDQSVAGIEEVPVVEVVDHHRLGMPPTKQPIKICCDIVGSSCTLITEMFLADNRKIPVKVAGILMGGIITDTLLLRSPTSCERDRAALAELQKITRIAPEDLMQEIFQVGSVIARSTPETVLSSDRKEFHYLDRIHFALSQVEEVSFDEFRAHENEILAALKTYAAQEKLALAGLLVTNVVRENSLLLAVAKPSILEQLPFRRLNDNLFDLPGVLSRKKQLLPQLLQFFDRHANQL